MASKFSKEDIDEQFEQFLKESLSDDSFGSEPKKKSGIPLIIGQTRNKETKKESAPWWLSEDDADNVHEANKFIKPRSEKAKLIEDGGKNILLSKNQPVRVVPFKPFSSASRSKALAKYKTLEKSFKAKKSVLSNKDEIPAINNHDRTEGLNSTSGSFLKSRRLSHAIVEVDEDHAEGTHLQQPCGASVSLSKDSLETNDSVVASGPNENFLEAGLDTLEEKEEKEKFFADLEKGASSTIDYSRLNKELDSNDSEILQAFIRNLSGVKQMEQSSEEEHKNHEKSGDYSDDFEEDSESNEKNKDEKAVASQDNEEKTGMLDKVVLLDSQDSTMEIQKDNEHQDAIAGVQHLPQEDAIHERSGTGISCEQTNSDIEALHQAYSHIEQSLGDTDEQRIQADKMESTANLDRNDSQHKEDCPQNTSATDSDLPTVEELLKPIRVGSSFTKETASFMKGTNNSIDDLVNNSAFKEQQNITSLEDRNTGQPRQQENISNQMAAKDDGEFSPYQRITKDKLSDKIRRDILRQNISPNSSLMHQDNKASKKPNTWNKEELNSVMNKHVVYKNTKNTAAIHKKKFLSGPHNSAKSSGYGKPSSPLKHFSTVNEKKTLKESIKKPVLKAKSPPRQREMFSGTRTVKTANDPTSPPKKCFNTPEQSSVSNLQQPPKESESCTEAHNVPSRSPQSSARELYLLKRAQEAEEKLTEAHDTIQHLKIMSLQKEKEIETKILEMKVQQDKALFHLNQENYVLQTQLNQREDLNKATKWTHICERIPDNGEVLKEIRKEVENQETLLQGYQQENERLYKQVKDLQMNNKKNEEHMFKENQRLMTELVSLREQMDKNNLLSCGMQNAEPTRNQNFTDLLLEVRAAKAVEINLLEEIKRLKQDKQAFEVDLGQVKKERDLARAEVASASAEKAYDMKIMEQTHREEINRLQKRLQWYAENQELLDKDAARLRKAKEEIDQLKLEVDKLRNEAGNHTAQQKKRLKDRTADAKRIQDLERQVKEMEGILRRRYPNSLPALIYAAATAGSEGDGDASTKANTADFLERRVKKLETELEGKDEEAKKSLRAMEQQFQKIKLQYEKRIGELEELLTYKPQGEPQKLLDKTANLAALQQELDSANTAHQVTVNNLQAEIDSLKQQIVRLELQKNTADAAGLESLEYQVEQAHTKAKLVRLNQEVAAKNREIQDLTKTVERLQKERRIMLSDKDSSSKTDNKEKSSGVLKKGISNHNQSSSREDMTFPCVPNDKIYQPNAFTDSSISEVMQENSQLRNDIEKLSLELSQERVKTQAALADFESFVRRAKEDSKEYIAALKESHQKELEKILCQHAVEHSTSKVAELNSKISTQEVLIKHLQQQVCESQRDQEALSISRKREEILQKEMAKLLEELRETRENQSPEMKRFVCLERKIKQLEVRYEHRERELQQVIQQTQHVAKVEQNQETEKWRKLALLKNQELEKFRIELDSMLDVLRQLHKQGVIIPAAGSHMPDSYWKI